MNSQRSRGARRVKEERSDSAFADFIDIAVIYMRIMGTEAAQEMMHVNGVPRRIAERIVTQVFRRGYVK